MSAIRHTKPHEEQVRELRHSSRLLVRALGVMRRQVDKVGCTPTQCHALIELSGRGLLTTGELARLIDLDKSTASRALRPLLSAGLIEAGADPGDQRTKPLMLTDSGRERVRQIHLAADTQVGAALDLLNEEERQAVLLGVSLYDRALRRAKALEGVVVSPIEACDNPVLARVIRSVMTEFQATGPGYSTEDAELDDMHRAYSDDRSAYFVAKRDGELVAGGGFAPLQGSDSDDLCELRKMTALPSARGIGVGRLLLNQCLSAAYDAGFRTCYLETLRHMHRARVLYEKAGFQPINGPMGRTGHSACDLWYVIELQAPPSVARLGKALGPTHPANPSLP